MSWNWANKKKMFKKQKEIVSFNYGLKKANTGMGRKRTGKATHYLLKLR